MVDLAGIVVADSNAGTSDFSTAGVLSEEFGTGVQKDVINAQWGAGVGRDRDLVAIIEVPVFSRGGEREMRFVESNRHEKRLRLAGEVFDLSHCHLGETTVGVRFV